MNKIKTSSFLLLGSIIALFISCSSNAKEEKKDAAKAFMKSQTIQYEDQKQPNHSEHVAIITDGNFKKTVKEGITVIDFWATWCKPCLMQAPVIDQLAEEYKGQVTIGKMDVDKNQLIPMEFNVQNIPTILIFKNGERVERFVGLQSKEALATAIQKHLDS